MSGHEHLSGHQFGPQRESYQTKRLQEDIQGIEAFGPRRWHEKQVRQRHVDRQLQTHGFGYRSVIEARRMTNVVDRAVREGVIEDWAGETDATGDMVATTDFAQVGGRSLRDFEFLPEVYDEAISGLIQKHQAGR